MTKAAGVESDPMVAYAGAMATLTADHQGIRPVRFAIFRP